MLSNNFEPTIILPACITSHSATLIDHMHYYEGMKSNPSLMIESGKFLNDLSDHLSNYTVLLNICKKSKTVRPLVRILSQKNKTKFVTT